MARPEYIPQTDPTNYTQKLDIGYLVLLQIQRVNQAAFEGDEIRFSNAVESLLNMLPKENRDKIEAHSEHYISLVEQPEYKYSCGKPMGSVENPVFRNKKSDWNYDGGEPILVSPIIREVEQTDYQKLYRFILEQLEQTNVTWKAEPKDRVEDKISPDEKPTPYLVNDTPSEQDLTELDEDEDLEDEQ